MNMLDVADDLFQVRLEVIYGGSGAFYGVVDEPLQQPQPAYIFSGLRRTLRVSPGCPCRSGMVIRTPAGQIFMVGDQGANDGVFLGFRLFEATHQMQWERRVRSIEPISGMPRDDGVEDMGLVWCAYEPASNEASGGAIRTPFERGRFITAAPIQRDDLVNQYRVARADILLGLRICDVG